MPVKQAKKRECITTYERTEDKMRGTIKGFLIVVFHAKEFFLKLIVDSWKISLKTLLKITCYKFNPFEITALDWRAILVKHFCKK